jgi:hypothetical protein
VRRALGGVERQIGDARGELREQANVRGTVDESDGDRGWRLPKVTLESHELEENGRRHGKFRGPLYVPPLEK